MIFDYAKFGKGEHYYFGQLSWKEHVASANGIGVFKRTSDEHILMCENFINNIANGIGFEWFPNKSFGYLTTYKNGKYFGPSLNFNYEKHLIYRNYDINGNSKGYSIFLFYNGNYIIYEESENSTLNAVSYIDGNLYFEKLTKDFTSISKKLIKYVGQDYKFTTCRMFCMKMNHESEKYHHIGGHNGLVYEINSQLLHKDKKLPLRYWGYGAIKWSDGNCYFGEFSDNKRTGIGCLIKPNGTKYLGKFYHDKKYGTCLALYSTGVVGLANWEEDHREGLSFEIYDDKVVIINYKNNKPYGNKIQIKNHAQYVNEYYMIEKNAVSVGQYYK